MSRNVKQIKKKHDSFFSLALGLLVRSSTLDDHGLRITNSVHFPLERDATLSGKGGKSCTSGLSLPSDWLKIQ